jgi:hypothetical protein
VAVRALERSAMKLHRFILAALILTISACTTIGDNQHRSPSGKYAIDFYQAQGESDSYYQIVNSQRPDFQYSSLGGATRLDDCSIFWSPTERTCLIHENRFGPWRVLHLVILPEQGDREYYEIHMRPLEKQHFRQEKIKAIYLSDEGVVFQLVDKNAKMKFSIKNLIAESQRQGSIYIPDEELRD